MGNGDEKASDTNFSMVAGVCPARSNVSDSCEKGHEKEETAKAGYC
jgi:hypothetical protein